jgi:hypothetical protein
MHSDDEQAVLQYLATSPNSFFSSREICRRAGSKDMWAKNQRWALPVLSRLVALGLVETDAAGHYRLTPHEE